MLPIARGAAVPAPGAVFVPPPSNSPATSCTWLTSFRPGGVAANEMLRTFNCGVGMIAVVSAEDVERVSAVLEAEGESVFTLGRMVARTEGAAGTSYKGTLAL